MAASAAAVAFGRGLRGSAVWAADGVRRPGSRPDPSKPEGIDLLPQFDHLVIYLQENHSYDNYFGMLPVGDGFTVVDGRPTPATTS
jgi:phospholipase C